MAEAMGVNTFRTKVTAFVLAAMLASISGWLFAHFQRTVNPSPFGLKMGIEYLFMAVIGGVGHVWGALVGAGVVKILEDQLQVWLPRLLGGSGNYEIIVFGILLVLVLQYARDGIWAFVEARLPRVKRKVEWAISRRCQRSRPPHGESCRREGRAQGRRRAVASTDGAQVRAGEILADRAERRGSRHLHCERGAAAHARLGQAARERIDSLPCARSPAAAFSRTLQTSR